jgi:hypothetical protein
MSINFFDIQCKAESNSSKFGLCDNPPPAEDPAYIDEFDLSKWIGVVHNPTSKLIYFYAIDHCVTILRLNGEREKRCDGMLHFNNTVFFVELKLRGSSGWLVKARNQLTKTLENFMLNYKLSDYDKVVAFACNGLKPFANQGNSNQLQKFKDDTGLIMYAQQDIHV